MTLTEETIERLLPQMRSAANQAEWLASRLAAIEAVVRTRETLQRAQEDLEARQAGERAELAARWERFRRGCGHEQTRYLRDPSGGGDGGRVCELCGAEL